MRKFLLLLLLPTFLFGQDDDSTKNVTFVPLPVIYKSPETSWAFGLGTFIAFKLPGQGEGVRSSQVQLGAAYTLNKQFLSYFPFDIYLNDGKTYLKGEAGYYKYFYFYYGIGPDALQEDEERYDVNFTKIDVNYLFQLNENSFLGPRIFVEGYNIVALEEGGELQTQNITGASGGFNNAIGLSYNYDTRNSVFYPTSGWRVDASAQYFDGIVGSDYRFGKFTLDVSHYVPIGKEAMIGFNLYQEYNTGEVPFAQLALIGGQRKHRGYYKGRFRDLNMFEFQTEFRTPVFWRCGGVVFAGLGQVWGKETAFSMTNLKYNFGIGGRFLLDKVKKVNGRGDLGFGQNTSGTYITVGEAF